MFLIEAKQRLGQYLQPYFDHKRYVEKQPLVYERKTSFGSSVVIATLSGDDEMAYAKLFIGIRHDLVELTLTNTFGLDDYFQNSSYSLLLHWKYVDPERILPCTNCGMTPISYDIALAKLKSLAAGAALARAAL